MAEATVPRELFAAMLDRVQRFGLPSRFVRRGWRGDQTKAGLQHMIDTSEVWSRHGRAAEWREKVAERQRESESPAP